MYWFEIFFLKTKSSILNKYSLNENCNYIYDLYRNNEHKNYKKYQAYFINLLSVKLWAVYSLLNLYLFSIMFLFYYFLFKGFIKFIGLVLT